MTANAKIADAIEACDWSGCSIGNKEILRAAVAALRQTPPPQSNLTATPDRQNPLSSKNGGSCHTTPAPQDHVVGANERQAMVDEIYEYAFECRQTATGAENMERWDYILAWLSNVFEAKRPCERTPPPQTRVRVKPLEWSKLKGLVGYKFQAFDCFGNEFARVDLRGQTDAEIKAFMAEKQAAYERRILSTLDEITEGSDNG